jgi:hypothetical protein
VPDQLEVPQNAGKVARRRARSSVRSERWGIMWQPKHSPDLLLVERMTMFGNAAQIVEGKAHRILIRVNTFGKVTCLPQSSV